MNEQCIFCKIYRNKKDEIIFENNYFYSQFDKFPVAPGHVEVIPKKHLVSLFDLSRKEWEALFPAIKETVKIIESADFKKLYTDLLKDPLNKKSKWFCEKMLSHIGIEGKPDGYNIGNNEGEAAGKTINHLHIHIIPRYFGDVKNPSGGIRHIIPNMGNYRKNNLPPNWANTL